MDNLRRRLSALPVLGLLLSSVLFAGKAGAALGALQSQQGPRATSPLRFTGQPSRFVTPSVSGSVKVAGSLPMPCYSLGYDPATNRLYTVAFPARVGWSIVAVDCSTNKVMGSAPFPAALSPGDLLNFQDVVARLKQATVPAVRYVRSRLSHGLIDEIDHANPAQPNETIKEALLRELNILIQGPLVRSPELLNLQEDRDRALLQFKLTPYEAQIANRRALSTALGTGVATVERFPGRVIAIEPGLRARVTAANYLLTLDTRSMRWTGCQLWTNSPAETRQLNGEWGLAPHDSKTGLVYRLVSGRNVLIVWRTDTPGEERTIAFEGLRRPYRLMADGLAYDEKTGKVYVSHGLADERITVISGQTLKRLGRIPVGQAPQWIAVNPRTHRLFVADALDNKVRVIDARSGRQIAQFQMPDRVTGIALSPKSGHIYVCLSCHLCIVLQDS